MEISACAGANILKDELQGLGVWRYESGGCVNRLMGRRFRDQKQRYPNTPSGKMRK